MYDIIIVGAGPAGLTSAIYAKRANKKVLVLEAVTYGGQIINTLDIENYPVEAHISGVDFSNKLYNQVKDMDVLIKFEKVVDIIDNGNVKLVKTSKSEYEAKAVILAVGADNRKLGLDNEEKLVGRGVSYCATCDGSFYKDKITAVVGGGNTAIEDALYLSDICSKVYLIHRRDEFRGEKYLVDKLKKKSNVEFILNSNVVKINADKKVESIDVSDKNTKEITNLKVDGIFIAVGRIPENQNFAKLIELDDNGYAVAGEDCHTKTKGIFVAGDNRVKLLRQLVTATGDGAVAAGEAVKYINNLKEE